MLDVLTQNTKYMESIFGSNVHKMEDPFSGYLVFQVFQNSALHGRVPVADAKITVNGMNGDGTPRTEVYMSDQDGKTVPIPLPTVNGLLTLNPEEEKRYSTYDAVVEKADYLSVYLSNIPIFDKITSIQPIDLLPTSPQISRASLTTYPFQEGR